MRGVKLFIAAMMVAGILLVSGCKIKEEYKFAQPVSSITSIEIVYVSREKSSK